MIVSSLLIFDLLLLTSILSLAWAALASRDERRSVILFMAFGLVLAVAWGRLLAPDVAVLSGAMINAGLLGWLRFLPAGDADLAGWGQLLLVAGITGIFFGAIAGLLQRSPRVLLGYSSISKMGVLTSGMGAALAWPATAPVVIAAVVMYAAHHALVKGALFLGLGLVERNGPSPWVQAGLVFLALALAGAPLTSGAFAKSILTASLPQDAQYLISLLAISAFATTLLMARFLLLVWRQRRRSDLPLPRESIIAWLILLAIIPVFPIVFAQAE